MPVTTAAFDFSRPAALRSQRARVPRRRPRLKSLADAGTPDPDSAGCIRRRLDSRRGDQGRGASIVEPSIEKLRDGDAESAWTAFLDRYRPVIWSTIRHYTTDGDDGAEIAAHVCAELSANDLAKLRAFAREPKPRATLATWLVAVVRNLTNDWVRHRDGRSRRHAPANLSPLQTRIYEHEFIEGRSHREAQPDWLMVEY